MTSRVPVRVRLVIAFSAVMAVVLTATGMFVYLRDKIDRPFGVETIETVRGAGYRLRGESS